MNLYLKYSPLTYTRSTRIAYEGDKKLKGKSFLFYLFGYFFYSIGVYMLSFIYFYFSKQITLLQLIEAIGLYLLLFIVFSIFYEIGYLHNDFIGKNEKNPTIRIYEKVDNKFYYIQIVIRIILGIIGIIVCFLVNPLITKYFSIITLITLFIYVIHNEIRDYFYNYMTLLGLRIMKFSLVLLVVYFMFKTFDSEYYLYLTIIFLMFQNYDHIILYNKRMGGFNNIKNGLGKYFYLFVGCIVLFFITKDHFFNFYGLLFFILFIALTPKDDFLGKTYKR